MRATLIVLIVINAVASFLIFVGAKSAIHEILATVTFLVAAVLLGAQAIMGSVDKMKTELADQLRQLLRAVEAASAATSSPPATVPSRVKSAAEVAEEDKLYAQSSPPV